MNVAGLKVVVGFKLCNEIFDTGNERVKKRLMWIVFYITVTTIKNPSARCASSDENKSL